MVHGWWFMVDSSWFMVGGSWFMVGGPGHLTLFTCPQLLSSSTP